MAEKALYSYLVDDSGVIPQTPVVTAAAGGGDPELGEAAAALPADGNSLEFLLALAAAHGLDLPSKPEPAAETGPATEPAAEPEPVAEERRVEPPVVEPPVVEEPVEPDSPSSTRGVDGDSEDSDWSTGNMGGSEDEDDDRRRSVKFNMNTAVEKLGMPVDDGGDDPRSPLLPARAIARTDGGWVGGWVSGGGGGGGGGGSSR